MFEIEEDVIIIRDESKFVYFLTVIILFFLQLYWLLFIYAMCGVTLIVFDDVVDELHEDDIYKQFLRHQDLHAIEERLGNAFIYDDLVELLEIVREDPILLDKSGLADSFKESLRIGESQNTLKISDKYSYLLTDNLSAGVKISNIKRLIKHKLVITDEFNEKYSEAHGFMVKLEMVKYKSLSLVVNEFLVNSFIARGIFPMGDYDFELFHNNNNSMIIPFFEYQLLEDNSNNVIVKTNNEIKN